MERSLDLGKGSIRKLLINQALPASIGFLVLSIYTVVDTIFVGRWVGSLGIAAVSVVAPIHFLISSIGMAIGIGGASVVSRSMGSKDYNKSVITFGNMMGFTLSLSFIFMGVGYFFNTSILVAFGAKGEILPYALDYFNYLLLSVPFLSWAMMCNNIIRAQGYPKVAMMVMILPSIANMIMDPIFIVYMDWGIMGAALSTAVAYIISALFTLYFLVGKNNKIRTNRLSHFKPHGPILKEIFKIGGVTIIRQGSLSILSIVINHSLFYYGNEKDVATYGIANRIMMFSLFPLLGIMQGVMPIVGFNYGAKQYKRVIESIKISILYSGIVSIIITVLLMGFAYYVVLLFSTEKVILNTTPFAIRMIFMALPLMGVQFISSAYFQSIGKALPALMLTISKQVFFLIPLIVLLPVFLGIKGVWYAFPVADVFSSLFCWWFLKKEMKTIS